MRGLSLLFVLLLAAPVGARDVFVSGFDAANQSAGTGADPIEDVGMVKHLFGGALTADVKLQTLHVMGDLEGGSSTSHFALDSIASATGKGGYYTLPGRCSTTFGQICNADAQCPAGETCFGGLDRQACPSGAMCNGLGSTCQKIQVNVDSFSSGGSDERAVFDLLMSRATNPGCFVTMKPSGGTDGPFLSLYFQRSNLPLQKWGTLQVPMQTTGCDGDPLLACRPGVSPATECPAQCSDNKNNNCIVASDCVSAKACFIGATPQFTACTGTGQGTCPGGQTCDPTACAPPFSCTIRHFGTLDLCQTNSGGDEVSCYARWNGVDVVAPGTFKFISKRCSTDNTAICTTSSDCAIQPAFCGVTPVVDAAIGFNDLAGGFTTGAGHVYIDAYAAADIGVPIGPSYVATRYPQFVATSRWTADACVPKHCRNNAAIVCTTSAQCAGNPCDNPTAHAECLDDYAKSPFTLNTDTTTDSVKTSIKNRTDSIVDMVPKHCSVTTALVCQKTADCATATPGGQTCTVDTPWVLRQGESVRSALGMVIGKTNNVTDTRTLELAMQACPVGACSGGVCTNAPNTGNSCGSDVSCCSADTSHLHTVCFNSQFSVGSGYRLIDWVESDGLPQAQTWGQHINDVAMTFSTKTPIGNLLRVGATLAYLHTTKPFNNIEGITNRDHNAVGSPCTKKCASNPDCAGGGTCNLPTGTCVGGSYLTPECGGETCTNNLCVGHKDGKSTFCAFGDSTGGGTLERHCPAPASNEGELCSQSSFASWDTPEQADKPRGGCGVFPNLDNASVQVCTKTQLASGLVPCGPNNNNATCLLGACLHGAQLCDGGLSSCCTGDTSVFCSVDADCNLGNCDTCDTPTCTGGAQNVPGSTCLDACPGIACSPDATSSASCPQLGACKNGHCAGSTCPVEFTGWPAFLPSFRGMDNYVNYSFGAFDIGQFYVNIFSGAMTGQATGTAQAFPGTTGRCACTIATQAAACGTGGLCDGSGRCVGGTAAACADNNGCLTTTCRLPFCDYPDIFVNYNNALVDYVNIAGSSNDDDVDCQGQGDKFTPRWCPQFGTATAGLPAGYKCPASTLCNWSGSLSGKGSADVTSPMAECLGMPRGRTCTPDGAHNVQCILAGDPTGGPCAGGQCLPNETNQNRCVTNTANPGGSKICTTTNPSSASVTNCTTNADCRQNGCSRPNVFFPDVCTVASGRCAVDGDCAFAGLGQTCSVNLPSLLYDKPGWCRCTVDGNCPGAGFDGGPGFTCLGPSGDKTCRLKCTTDAECGWCNGTGDCGGGACTANRCVGSCDGGACKGVTNCPADVISADNGAGGVDDTKCGGLISGASASGRSGGTRPRLFQGIGNPANLRCANSGLQMCTLPEAQIRGCSCTGDGDCGGGGAVCKRNVCVPTGALTACVRDTDCASGRCASKVCRTFKTACTADSQCVGGQRCMAPILASSRNVAGYRNMMRDFAIAMQNDFGGVPTPTIADPLWPVFLVSGLPLPAGKMSNGQVAADGECQSGFAFTQWEADRTDRASVIEQLTDDPTHFPVNHIVDFRGNFDQRRMSEAFHTDFVHFNTPGSQVVGEATGGVVNAMNVCVQPTGTCSVTHAACTTQGDCPAPPGTLHVKQLCQFVPQKYCRNPNKTFPVDGGGNLILCSAATCPLPAVCVRKRCDQDAANCPKPGGGTFACGAD